MDIQKVKNYLNLAQKYADEHTGCRKVAVGCVILARKAGTPIEIFGANRAIPNLCKTVECQRIQLYGEDSKNHRLPSDCRAIHSEVDAIARCAKFGIPTQGCTAIVTRYPCEACARTLVDAGITTVYYGRDQLISKQTEEIFKTYNVTITHVKGWDYDDVLR